MMHSATIDIRTMTYQRINNPSMTPVAGPQKRSPRANIIGCIIQCNVSHYMKDNKHKAINNCTKMSIIKGVNNFESLCF